jgi:hypothetical protein
VFHLFTMETTNLLGLDWEPYNGPKKPKDTFQKSLIRDLVERISGRPEKRNSFTRFGTFKYNNSSIFFTIKNPHYFIRIHSDRLYL